MELKFFNILDIRTFSDKLESEQKSILIETNTYKKGKSDKVEFSLDEGEIWRGSSNYPKYLGQDFEFNGIDYKLNDVFLNEVFNECVSYIKFHHAPLIENNIETLKLQAEFSEDDFIAELRQKEIKSYNNYLPQKLFKKLHNSNFENEQEHFDMLKSYLSVNWYDLSDYLFGLKNIQNYHIVTTYYSYVRTKRTLFFLNSKNVLDETVEVDNKKLSRPKFIAMLNELGFFQLNSIKDLNNEKKAQIILALLELDYKNTSSIHSVVKNIQILNPKSILDGKKHTSWTHIEGVKKIINQIRNKI